jgi:hypothetical protein
MSELERPRPVLATVICIYEGILVFFGLLSIAFLAVGRAVNPSLASTDRSVLRSVLPWIAYLLAIGIAITLWQMRREAFYLAATRLGLSVLGTAWAFIHPTHVARVSRVGQPQINMHAVGAVTILFAVIVLSINAAITFYIQDITRPMYGAER